MYQITRIEKANVLAAKSCGTKGHIGWRAHQFGITRCNRGPHWARQWHFRYTPKQTHTPRPGTYLCGGNAAGKRAGGEHISLKFCAGGKRGGGRALTSLLRVRGMSWGGNQTHGRAGRCRRSACPASLFSGPSLSCPLPDSRPALSSDVNSLKSAPCLLFVSEVTSPQHRTWCSSFCLSAKADWRATDS